MPVGTTGVIRRGEERNSDILAERHVEVVMIPGEQHVSAWLRPRRPDQLRQR